MTLTKATVHSFLLVPLWLLPVLNGSGQFTDVTAAQLCISNINENTIYGNGISFYDFTGDGLDDLTIANGADAPWFFVNNNGQFEPAPFTITNPQAAQVMMLLWADYDNDGDSDLLITKDGAPMQLWQNDGNLNFTNVAVEAGLEQANFSYWGAAMADYNHDGCLDLFVAKYYHPTFNPGPQFRCQLYRSNCNGTFTEVTLSAGINLPPRPVFQPVFFDYDNDGWEDIFLVIDRIQFTNELFHNNGDGSFTNVTVPTGVNQSICSMTGTIDDFDNDLDEDIYVTNGPTGNLLLVNNGNSTFTESAAAYGVDMYQLTWGSLWIDYDNNSWQDLFVSVTSPYLPPIGNQLFINNQGAGFTNGTVTSGFDDDVTETYQVCMGDFNNDGYYDFANNNKPPHISRLWQNNGGANHYLSISLKGVLANRDGVGTWLHCYAAGNHYVRFTKCGENFISQNSAKEIFGLGDTDLVDSLVVKWNSGTVDVFTNVAANQHMHIVEGSSFALPFDITYEGNLVLCGNNSVVLHAGNWNSYLWSNGQSTADIVVNQPGTYWVTVINSFGAEVVSNPITVVASPPVVVWPIIEPISCTGANDGSVQLQLTEGAIANVLWNGVPGSEYEEGLGPGIYNYTITNQWGCQASGSLSITEPPALQVSASFTDALCHNENSGTAQLQISGGTSPYNINWFGQNPGALTAGSFEYEVTDQNGCIVSGFVVIGAPDELELSLQISPYYENGPAGSIELFAQGGTPPYEVQWSDGTLNEFTLTGLAAGFYSALVTDSHGCEAEISGSVEYFTGVNEANSDTWLIYPNPVNRSFFVNGPQRNFSAELFNPMGQIVWSAMGLMPDQKIELPALPAGIYQCRLTCIEYTGIAHLVITCTGQ